jgi:hypothetical protein
VRVLISWARMVPVRARAWNAEASAPAARVRLWEIAAQTSQAALALNTAEDPVLSGERRRARSSLLTRENIAWRCQIVCVQDQ